MEWIKKNLFTILSHVSAKWLYYAGASLVVLILSVFGINVAPPPVPDEPIFPDGWKQNQVEVLKVREGLDFKRFSETPAFKAVQDVGDPDEVFLWKAYLKVDGKIPNAKNQGQVGSCVGFGTTSAIETSFIVSLSADPNLAANPPPHRFAEEVTYGISRVDIGGGQIGGDGSIGAWAVEGSKKIGLAQRKKYSTYDLNVYNERTCREFGRRGIPADVKEDAKLHPIKDFTQVVTVAEAYKSLANGYAIVVCSNRGFSTKRDADGFCSPSGTWNHCMCILGYKKGKRPGFFIWNSWGDNSASGPKGAGDPPEGGFWADEVTVGRMLVQGDSWSVTDIKGFEPRPVDKLDWFVGVVRDRKFANVKKELPFALAY